MAKSYVPAPRVPEEVLARYQTVLEVLGGGLTVSEGARRLGISRIRFQTLMHRGLSGLLEGLEIKPPGRPTAGEREKELLEAKAHLERENERLRRRVETTDRLLGMVKGFLRGRAGPKERRGRSKGPTTTEGG